MSQKEPSSAPIFFGGVRLEGFELGTKQAQEVFGANKIPQNPAISTA